MKMTSRLLEAINLVAESSVTYLCFKMEKYALYRLYLFVKTGVRLSLNWSTVAEPKVLVALPAP
jgi:hypothetical protein